MEGTQLTLFEGSVGKPRRTRAGYVHVLRDPGVAASINRRANLGCDLLTAFASFWAALPPERRAELKARVAA